ncbi:MAG: hypothetical protein JJ863_15475 [Deltaproteobacteria bacterium]|nr:hypothetical protein [Deltaproteobacteria bacterium]
MFLCGEDQLGNQQVICEPIGQQICCASGPEHCDGEDNDCDGWTDEGLCGADGTSVCQDGNYVSCSDGVACNGAEVCFAGECQSTGTPPGGTQAAAEICGDGIDNDCDGVVDAEPDDGNPCTTEVCNGSLLDITPVAPSALCPAAPHSSAPVSPDGRPLPFDEDVEFLYTGTDPYQRGVADGAIAPELAARIHGRVFSHLEYPMGGVLVEVVGRPDLGEVRTRADGRWEMVVEGDRQVRVRFNADDQLEVQRSVFASAAEHGWVDRVVMTPVDSNVSPILFGSSAMQVHDGSDVTDADGTRHAMVMVKAGTTATVDGTPFSGGDLRVTEYTVGKRGPDAMPAPMPSHIAYTYAAEFAFDGVPPDAEVSFSQPVVFYLENFLGYRPVSDRPAPIPVGSYDRVSGEWVAEPDGLILNILGTSGGLAQIDVDFDDEAETASELAQLGIDAAERAELGANGTPREVWRVELDHFTPYDLNWPYDVSDGAEFPPFPLLEDIGVLDQPCTVPGSIIECQNQTLAEEIPLLGWNQALRFQSDRVPSFHQAFQAKTLVNDGSPRAASFASSRIGVEVAGRRFEYDNPTLTTEPAGEAFVFDEWDGRDWAGRRQRWPEPVTIEICDRYQARPLAPGDTPTNLSGLLADSGSRSFGDRGVPGSLQTTISTGRSAGAADLCQRAANVGRLGVYDAKAVLALGGLTLTGHHSMHRGEVQLGSGVSGRARPDRGTTITTTVGRNRVGPPGSMSTTPENLSLRPVVALAADDVERLIFSELDGSTWRVELDQSLTEIGPSIVAPALAPLPDGSTLALDWDQPQALWLLSDGSAPVPLSAAGVPDCGALDSGVLGTTPVGDLGDVAADVDGTIYLWSRTCGRILAVDPAGQLSVVAGGQSGGLGPEDPALPGANARTLRPLGASEQMAVWQGNVYFAMDVSGAVGDALLRVRPDGSILPLLGTSTADAPLSLVDSGVPARTRYLTNAALRLTVSPEGVVFFESRVDGLLSIWSIDQRGVLTLLAGGGGDEAPFDGSAAGRASLPTFAAAGTGEPSRALAAFGNRVYRASTLNANVGQVEEIAVPDFGTVVPTSSGIARFDDRGRHLSNHDPLTGDVLESFEYLPDGRLDRIVDQDGGMLSFGYSTGEVLITRSAPWNTQTRVVLDANGWVDRVEYVNDPDAASSDFVFDEVTEPNGGRLDYLVDRRGHIHDFVTEPLGRLKSDTLRAFVTRPTGGCTTSAECAGDSCIAGACYETQAMWSLEGSDTLERETLVDGSTAPTRHRQVTVNSVGDSSTYSTVHDVVLNSAGEEVRTITQPGGIPGPTVVSSEWTQTVTYPDGTTSIIERSPSPAPGQDSYVSRVETILPSMLSSTSAFTQTTTTATSGFGIEDSTWTSTRDPDGLAESATTTFTRTLPSGAPLGAVSMLESQSAEGRRTRAFLNAEGRPIWSAWVRPDGTPVFDPITATYDSQGRPTGITQGVRSQTFDYDGPTGDRGWLWQAASTAGIELTATNPDVFGRPETVELSELGTPAAELGLDYDAEGRLAELTTPTAETHTMTHGPTGQLERYSPPSVAGSPTGDTRWLPGEHRGELDRKQTPVGNVVPTYDPVTGRLEQVGVTGVGSITFGYTPLPALDNGELRQATMPQQGGLADVTTEWDYDGPGVVLEERTDGMDLPNAPYAVHFTRGTRGALWLRELQVATAAESHDFDYAYDADGLITQAGPLVVVPDRQTSNLDATCLGGAAPVMTGGAVTDCTGNVRTVYTDDADGYGALDQMTTTWSTGSFQLDFTYDAAGRIETIVDNGVTRAYDYDAAGRLVDVTSSDGNDYHYDYDANGNRVGWVTPDSTCDVGAGCVVVDEQDRLRVHGGVTFDYDDAGRLVARHEGGDTTQYGYDPLGNLRDVTMPGTTIRYAVDSQGRRVARFVDGEPNSSRFWIYQDGLNPVAQLDASGNLQMIFIYGTQAHVPSVVVLPGGAGADTVLQVITDQVGSVRALVDASTEQLVFTVDYSPFGTVLDERNIGAAAIDFVADFPFRFAGGHWDATTQLIRFGARDYDPEVGRWLSKDPTIFLGRTSNLYEYCYSSPSSFVDPDGELPIFLVLAAVAAATTFTHGVVSDAVAGKEIQWAEHGENALWAGLAAGFVSLVGPALGLGSGATALGVESGASVGFGTAANRVMNGAVVGATSGLFKGLSRRDFEPSYDDVYGMDPLRQICDDVTMPTYPEYSPFMPRPHGPWDW